jgi:hypothetical protein
MDCQTGPPALCIPVNVCKISKEIAAEGPKKVLIFADSAEPVVKFAK